MYAAISMQCVLYPSKGSLVASSRQDNVYFLPWGCIEAASAMECWLGLGLESYPWFQLMGDLQPHFHGNSGFSSDKSCTSFSSHMANHEQTSCAGIYLSSTCAETTCWTLCGAPKQGDIGLCLKSCTLCFLPYPFTPTLRQQTMIFQSHPTSLPHTQSHCSTWHRAVVFKVGVGTTLGDHDLGSGGSQEDLPY